MLRETEATVYAHAAAGRWRVSSRKPFQRRYSHQPHESKKVVNVIGGENAGRGEQMFVPPGDIAFCVAF